MSDRLCLKWHDFQSTVTSAFQDFRSSRDFCDVTLACEDGQQVEAHKVVLSASSSFFHDLLRRHKQPSPIIFMKGMKSEDLNSIVDFMYFGKVIVHREKLDAFFVVAEELRVKGLKQEEEELEDIIHNKNTGSESRALSVVKQHSEQDDVNVLLPRKSNVKQDSSSLVFPKKTIIRPDNANFGVTSTQNFQQHSYKTENINRKSLFKAAQGSADPDELDKIVKSFMKKSKNLAPSGTTGSKAQIYRVWRKEEAWVTIRNHIEAKHLKGIFLPCEICGIAFRSRNQLRKHKYKCSPK